METTETPVRTPTRGRPRLPGRQGPRLAVIARLTVDERELLDARVAAAGITESAYVRECLGLTAPDDAYPAA